MNRIASTTPQMTMRTRVHRVIDTSQLLRSLARPAGRRRGRRRPRQRPIFEPNDVLGRGWPHTQLVARDADDPVRVLEHPDFDVEAPALLRQLGVRAPLASERVR